ncbi:L-threonylcarbamoyladenylate synthase [Tabrizicola oligotrophica]|uniref:Threonylcarbamoyl-AMP synthase n=1 Tax=Tabrizicola oligotrophica TaxID=2710650 RepID=A0A6M0QTT7_9RHOB|nr:L-threonylcarbamoyladenylate synthase [Tabrizicola oligotrophica]NEY90898.1 threonylcarbamoyl-AMP synthase [Tabrizicola oligotrophica]
MPDPALPLTESLSPDAPGLARAAAILAKGGLVAFPTETVYGLGGDAKNSLAVAGIYEAKGRPRFNPLIVHVADLAMAERFALFDDRARAVAAAFWPGPLTLVLPLLPDTGLSPLVTAELDTVAIRIPAHPVAQALIRAFGGPLAAPSANPSGKVSPTRAEHVAQGLSGRIAAIVDGGACAVGVESTILGLAGPATLLRPGGVALEALEALIGPVALRQTGDKLSAPGQLASHYAPAAPLRLNAQPAAGEVHIGFGPDTAAGPATLNLSPAGDLAEAAANLFHMLREADRLAGPQGRISAAPIPNEGLGRAINDRLARAAAPRP